MHKSKNFLLGEVIGRKGRSFAARKELLLLLKGILPFKEAGKREKGNRPKPIDNGHFAGGGKLNETMKKRGRNRVLSWVTLRRRRTSGLREKLCFIRSGGEVTII